jgi:hypothetical protein
MKCCDWSSDVCSSDLFPRTVRAVAWILGDVLGAALLDVLGRAARPCVDGWARARAGADLAGVRVGAVRARVVFAGAVGTPFFVVLRTAMAAGRVGEAVSRADRRAVFFAIGTSSRGTPGADPDTPASSPDPTPSGISAASTRRRIPLGRPPG